MTFAVEEAFRSVGGKTVSVRNLFGTDCSIKYRTGETYLIYAAVSNGNLFTGGCMRIRVAAVAQDEIAHLRRISSSPTGGVVVGTVKTYAQNRNFMSALNKPVSGKTVRLEGPLGGVDQETDSFGRYAFAGLAPGSYRLTAALGEEFKPVVSPEFSLDVQTGECRELDFRTDFKSTARR